MSGIVVVDYHKGNLLSVVRGLADAGAEAVASDDPATIRDASGVVLPGVGSFEDAMDYMRESGEDVAVLDAIGRGVPFLGICLGLHLLFERGDERSAAACGAPATGAQVGTAEPNMDGRWVAGLGVIPGSCTRLVPQGCGAKPGRPTSLKVPHVGWDQLMLTPHGLACPLFAGVAQGANFYFTHSYAVDGDVPAEYVAGRTHYVRSFASAVWKGNVFGVQFHPEKSSAMGRRILENYVAMVRAGGVGGAAGEGAA